MHGGDNLENTIHYVDNLNILSGTINNKGAFWVNGILNMSGGTVNIDTEDMVSQRFWCRRNLRIRSSKSYWRKS